MKSIMWICLLLLSNIAVAADVFTGTDPRSFEVGEPLEVGATIGGYPVWQGEGKWRMFALLRRDSTGTAAPIPLGQLRVFQTEDKKLVAVLQVSANLSGGVSSDWTDEPCKREDLLFKGSLGGAFRDVNCVTINHIANYLANPSDSFATLYALFKEQNVDVPPTVLQLAFTRYSNNGRRLVVTLTINPELAGFQRDSESWGRNSWHKTQVSNNPEKKIFIDALAYWAIAFARQMDIAFEKDVNAFVSIPSWRSVYDNRRRAESVTKPKLVLD